MSNTQFQLEAVEIECSRLLSMEDQLISIVNLLKWAKEKVDILEIQNVTLDLHGKTD